MASEDEQRENTNKKCSFGKKNVFEFYISLTNSTLTMSPGYLSLFPLPEVKVVFMCVAQGSHHLAYAGLAGWQ